MKTFIKRSDLKRLLNKSFSKKEKQRIKVEMDTHYNSNLTQYLAVGYWKRIRIAGMKKNTYINVSQEQILEALRENITEYDVTGFDLTFTEDQYRLWNGLNLHIEEKKLKGMQLTKDKK